MNYVFLLAAWLGIASMNLMSTTQCNKDQALPMLLMYLSLAIFVVLSACLLVQAGRKK